MVVIIAVSYFEAIFNLCTMKVNLALGSTTVWPKLHLLVCSSIAHLAIFSWNTNTWSDTTPLYDKSFGSVIISNSSKYHRNLENVIGYWRYCDDISIAKMIVSGWVILRLTAITRSYASNIQNRGDSIVFDWELDWTTLVNFLSLHKIDKSDI